MATTSRMRAATALVGVAVGACSIVALPPAAASAAVCSSGKTNSTSGWSICGGVARSRVVITCEMWTSGNEYQVVGPWVRGTAASRASCGSSASIIFWSSEF